MHQSPFIFCVCVLLQWLLVTRSSCGLATSDTVPSSQLLVTHSATILGTNEPRNLRVLYRLFGPDTREYVFVSGTNRIYQFDAHNLQPLAVRVIGPQNFSIFCSDEHDCSYCLIGPHETWPKGYSPDFCGPRPTDNFVKAWATSTVSENDVVRRSYTFVPVVINDDRIACEDALYMCYNVHHGYCERVRLHNVTKEAPWTTTHLDYADHPIPGRVPVVGCDPITHATIVVGARYVYTATEPDIQRLFTLSALDPLSVRSRDFYFVDSTPERKSVVSLDDPPIPLQYKASFRYRTRATFVPVSDPTVNVPPAHVYFVLQQPDHVRFIRWQPRVARICEGDKRFYSYVELNLACSDCVPLVDRDQKADES
ncbi:putative plexin [Fasciola gigantica]|uniref:Putative plexin n=1 Tax=Fasciola gigantica TaxID=46835 RepID=A0A504YZS5_FASGI|nr:putative plexin [Fasciola gigantica]